jgi:hypothetical protein
MPAVLGQIISLLEFLRSGIFRMLGLGESRGIKLLHQNGEYL